MVRVAGLVGQMRAGISELSQDGLTPAEQLEQVRKLAQELMAEQDTRWLQLREELARERHRHRRCQRASPTDERAWLDERFLDHILPVVTPIAIDPAHPFPFIPNRGFIIALAAEAAARTAAR